MILDRKDKISWFCFQILLMDTMEKRDLDNLNPLLLLTLPKVWGNSGKDNDVSCKTHGSGKSSPLFRFRQNVLPPNYWLYDQFMLASGLIVLNGLISVCHCSTFSPFWHILKCSFSSISLHPLKQIISNSFSHV